MSLAVHCRKQLDLSSKSCEVYVTQELQGSRWSGKSQWKKKFSRSVKSQWILWEVSEKLDLPKSQWKVSEFETALVLATLNYLYSCLHVLTFTDLKIDIFFFLNFCISFQYKLHEFIPHAIQYSHLLICTLHTKLVCFLTTFHLRPFWEVAFVERFHCTQRLYFMRHQLLFKTDRWSFQRGSTILPLLFGYPAHWDDLSWEVACYLKLLWKVYFSWWLPCSTYFPPQVGTLHTEMVKWMVQLLLRLAPDRKEHSAEAREAVLLGSATVGELQSSAKSLFGRLEMFSKYVAQ